MTKTLSQTIVYCFTCFIVLAIVESILGTHELYITKYPSADAFAIYSAIGVFAGLSSMAEGQDGLNLRRALLYCACAYTLNVLIVTVFGVQNWHFTKYPDAEDFAIYSALGFFIGRTHRLKRGA